MLQRDARHVKTADKVEGRWYPTYGANPAYVAKCGVCGRVRSAVELRLRRLPWGRGEVWACWGNGCSK